MFLEAHPTQASTITSKPWAALANTGQVESTTLHTWVEVAAVPTMSAHVHHSAVLVEDLLCPIAMVHVPVHDHYSLGPCLRLRTCRIMCSFCMLPCVL